MIRTRMIDKPACVHTESDTTYRSPLYLLRRGEYHLNVKFSQTTDIKDLDDTFRLTEMDLHDRDQRCLEIIRLRFIRVHDGDGE